MTGFAQVKRFSTRSNRISTGTACCRSIRPTARIWSIPLDWQTKEQLQKIVVWRYEGGAERKAVSYPLIDLSDGKTAKDTYLIKALTAPFRKQVDPRQLSADAQWRSLPGAGRYRDDRRMDRRRHAGTDQPAASSSLPTASSRSFDRNGLGSTISARTPPQRPGNRAAPCASRRRWRGSSSSVRIFRMSRMVSSPSLAGISRSVMTSRGAWLWNFSSRPGHLRPRAHRIRRFPGCGRWSRRMPASSSMIRISPIGCLPARCGGTRPGRPLLP